MTQGEVPVWVERLLDLTGLSFDLLDSDVEVIVHLEGEAERREIVDDGVSIDRPWDLSETEGYEEVDALSLIVAIGPQVFIEADTE